MLTYLCSLLHQYTASDVECSVCILEKRPAKPFVEDSLEMSNAFTKGQPYNAKTGEVHPNKAQYPSQQLYEKQHHAGNSHGHKTNSSSGQHLQSRHCHLYRGYLSVMQPS